LLIFYYKTFYFIVLTGVFVGSGKKIITEVRIYAGDQS